MSRENVEIAKRMVADWNRDDWATLMASFAPDVIAVPPHEWPEGETGTDRDRLRRQFERMKSAWEDERIEIDEIRDLGDRVLSLLRWIARGKGSHVEVEQPVATLATLRDGKVVRIEYFVHQSDALEAAGLSE